MFVSMGYDWPVEINIDNKHAVGAANYIICKRVADIKKLQLCCYTATAVINTSGKTVYNYIIFKLYII